ncbi:EscU/YscU/HrcU family type III secretion system export apparatus switch protein [Thermaerobacter sp. PB12/4term]|uniref:EscU/YscU/HrcU family type III secretion system export apparatus switch protein n=1 Tax=Thermaerobacter sp. PB12/4term TaxID=2293838 RepID=UPI000E32A31B|nr:EscU/YscU/HrcU family type III secretion system export apparatus switch protein [Thermaerobacter sp. PB12/4term]QIA26948.1 EscU/YscU/HrcU family type III secretion system export apparatus switch protein [Thermaerobacter sp. PB12/4term]
MTPPALVRPAGPAVPAGVSAAARLDPRAAGRAGRESGGTAWPARGAAAGAGAPLRRIRLQLFAGERVLPPSPRRLREARRRGQVARSADLPAALVLLALAALAGTLVPLAARQVAGLARRLWAPSPAPLPGDWTVAQAADLGRVVLLGTLAAAGPLALAGWVVAAAAGFVQAGGLFQPGLAAPRWERVNPLAGLQRLVSRRALVELLKAPVKLAVMAAALGPALLGAGMQLITATGAPLPAMLGLAGRSLQGLLWRGALAYLVVALADYAYQWWEHQQSLRMTVQEWKQDQKEAEGDPVLRQRIRQRQRYLARRRMLQEVPRADVVVTNPTHVAVALRYDPARMGAPVVVAKGVDFLALRIRALAEQHGVPVMEEPALARALYRAVEVGREIPAAFYVAVAEVLAFVWRLRGRAGPAGGQDTAGPGRGPGPAVPAGVPSPGAEGSGEGARRAAGPGGWGSGEPGAGEPGRRPPVRPGRGEVR